MKYIINHKIFTIFLIFIWCLLCNNFSFYSIITGSIIAPISIILGCHIPNGTQYLDSLNISIFNFLKFITILLINIYISTFQMLKIIITSRINPKLIYTKTSLHNEWSIFLLANAITLTPGTVTINKKGDTLLILTTDQNESNSIIK